MANDRFFALFGEHRSAIAMDIKNVSETSSKLTFAVAFCNKRDSFNKKIARDILNGRLDSRIKLNEEVRLTFDVLYEGTHPKRDVMNPLMDAIRINKARPHSIVAGAIRSVSKALTSPLPPFLTVCGPFTEAQPA
jgi:hypothetical protein